MGNVIFNENCKDTMSRLPSNILDGIITSPPYNIATQRKDCYYNNGYVDNLSEEEYLDIRLNEFIEFSRLLKDKGVICYNISYSKENPILPLLLINRVHLETDLTVADIISWKKSHCIPFQTSATELSRLTELIYVIVKKKELHTFKTNKEVSKINKNTGQKFYKNYTNYIEAKNNDGFKCKLKASYSQDLCDQLIKIYFPQDSLIYDPFMGIGTTALSCIKNNCKYIGSEIDVTHYDISNERLNNKFS